MNICEGRIEMNSSGDENLQVRKEGTGVPIPLEYRDVVYPFRKYEITVRLTPDNEFIGIVEVKINKDFISYKQRLATKGFHDVDEFYRE